MPEHAPQRVVIAGGHGRVALLLTQLLVDRGDEVVSLLGNPNHSTELQALGAEPVYIDLEQAKLDELESVLEESDAVVFASGAGESEDFAIDRGAAALLADAAEIAGVRRFIRIADAAAIPDAASPAAPRDSAPSPATSGAAVPNTGYARYLAAEIAADQDLQGRGDLDWTIVRVGRLGEEPGGVSASDVAQAVLELIESTGEVQAVVPMSSIHSTPYLSTHMPK